MTIDIKQAKEDLWQALTPGRMRNGVGYQERKVVDAIDALIEARLAERRK